MGRVANTNVITNMQANADGNPVSDLDFLFNNKVTTFYPSVAYVKDEVEQAQIYRNCYKSRAPISDLSTFFDGLKGVMEKFSFANDSILYWVAKYRYTCKEIIAGGSTTGFLGRWAFPNWMTNLAGVITGVFDSSQGGFNSSEGGLTNFYDTTSDSIGIMANSKYIQLDSTLPLMDITQEYYGVPIPFAASTESKISPATRNLMYVASRGTTAMMRRNLIPVAYGNTILTANLAVDGTLPHAVNLINDIPTLVKINDSVSDLVGGMASAVPGGKLFAYVQWLCNIGNRTGFNLRDTRPVAAYDQDFVVVTSEQRSAGISDAISAYSQNAFAETLVASIAAQIGRGNWVSTLDWVNGVPQTSGQSDGGYIEDTVPDEDDDDVSGPNNPGTPASGRLTNARGLTNEQMANTTEGVSLRSLGVNVAAWRGVDGPGRTDRLQIDAANAVVSMQAQGIIDNNGSLPFQVTAAYANGGHSRNSQHYNGIAVDLQAINGFTNSQIVTLARQAGFTFVLDEGSHVHADMR